MKGYNEQVVETLDDAGCIIANKNIIIDNLQARVRELEEDAETYVKKDKANYELRQQLAAAQEENGRLENQVLARDAELWGRTQEILGLKEQLAAEQLNNKLLDALQEYIDEHEECQDADDWTAMMCSMEAHHAADKAPSQPSDTSALDSFVAEKVKDVQLQDIEQYLLQMAGISTAAIGYWKEDDSIHPDYDTPAIRDVAKLYANYESRTKQRDLAVEALKSCGVNDGLNGPTQYFDEDLVERAIKESEAK